MPDLLVALCQAEVIGWEQGAFCFDSTSAGPGQMCPVMSWLLCLSLWVSVTGIQLCQATFYDTIQQHHGTRPGRTTIHMIGESFTVLLFFLTRKTHIKIIFEKNVFSCEFTTAGLLPCESCSILSLVWYIDYPIDYHLSARSDNTLFFFLLTFLFLLFFLFFLF